MFNYQKREIMKNFQVIAIESVNGVMNVQGALYPRSVVLVNKSGTYAYNFNAKVRDFNDPKAVVKALLRTLVEVKRWELEQNTTEAAQHTKRWARSPFASGMSGTRVWVADKNGKVVSQSVFEAEEGMTLRKLFVLTKSNPLYQLVVEQGKAWTTPEVVEALNQNVQRTLELNCSVKKLDEAIATASAVNDKDKAADKAETTDAVEKAA